MSSEEHAEPKEETREEEMKASSDEGRREVESKSKSKSGQYYHSQNAKQCSFPELTFRARQIPVSLYVASLAV